MAPLAGTVVVLHALLLASCRTYDRETAIIAPQAQYFPTPKSSAQIPAKLVDALGESDILLLGESHYVSEHHQFIAMLLPRLQERGFRLFMAENNHAQGVAFDEYVTGRRDSLTPAQSGLDGIWLEAVRALNAQLRASGRERDQMRVRAIDVNHWRSVYRVGAMELANRSGIDQLQARIESLPPTDTAGYREALESLAAELDSSKDRMGLAEADFAALKDMTKMEIASAGFRSSRVWKDREGAMYDAVVAALDSPDRDGKVVIHCGMTHAQLCQVWEQEPFQPWDPSRASSGTRPCIDDSVGRLSCGRWPDARDFRAAVFGTDP